EAAVAGRGQVRHWPGQTGHAQGGELTPPSRGKKQDRPGVSSRPVLFFPSRRGYIPSPSGGTPPVAPPARGGRSRCSSALTSLPFFSALSSPSTGRCPGTVSAYTSYWRRASTFTPRGTTGSPLSS